MSLIVVSPGYGSDAGSVWFPYLRDALAALGHRVVVPPLGQVGLDRWVTALAAAAAGTPPADTVLVGHSIGGVNVLRLLERHAGEPFAGAVLVSTPAREVGYEALAEFFAVPFDWARIRRAARRFEVLTAVDDPVLIPSPVEHVRELVVGLGARAVVTPDGGHYGADPEDHVDLPEAVDLTLRCLAVSTPA